MGWFEKAFSADPAGWLSLGLATLILITGLIFRKRTWALLQWLGEKLLKILRWVFSLRVTTADRLPKEPAGIVPPVRWDIVKLKDAKADEFALANFGEGSVARDVQLDILGNGGTLRSAAAWGSIDGGRFGPFTMRVEEAGYWGGISFSVEWTSVSGARQRSIVELASR